MSFNTNIVISGRQIAGPTGPVGPQGPAGLTGPGVPLWAATTAYATNQVAIAPDGTAISRIAAGTSRSSYDSSEKAAWNVLTLATAQRGAANGVASLDGSGVVPASQLPAIAINKTYVVNSQAAMLALAANVGDVAIRTDLSPQESFILQTAPATTLGNWQQLTTPGAVTSVVGLAGAVSGAQIAADPALAPSLLATDQTVHTAAFTAVANTLHTFDSTAGAVAITLPTAPADKTRITLKDVAAVPLGGTYTCGGSDVINKPSGVTSGSLKLASEAVTLQYDATRHIWVIVSIDLPLVSLDGRYAPVAVGAIEMANTQRIMRALHEGNSNQSIMVISDSTAAGASGPTCWPFLLATYLASKLPAYTVQTVAWNDGSQNESAAVVVQTGTGTGNSGGPFVLTVYNYSVSGKNCDYPMGATILSWIAKRQPDQILIAHGKNEPSPYTVGDTETFYESRFLGFTEFLSLVCPRSAITIVLQPPDVTDNPTTMSYFTRAWTRVANQRGYGLIDAYQPFLDNPGWSTTLGSNTLMTDNLHPNQTGQNLYASTVEACFTYLLNAPMKAQEPSSLATSGEQLLWNGDFASWSSTVPDGWAVTNATVSKDYRFGENPTTEYGCRVQASSAAASCITWQFSGAALNRMRGRMLTVAVKLQIPASNTSARAGLVQIADQIGATGNPSNWTATSASRVESLPRTQTVWTVARQLIDPGSPLVTLNIYADAASGATADVTILEVRASIGALPKAGGRFPAAPITPSIAAPANIPGLAYYSEPNGLGLSNGAAVTALTDLSGNGVTASQGTGANQATLDSTTVLINGMATALFSANQFYNTSLAMPAQVTEYAVIKNYSTGAVGSIFGNAGGSSAAQFTKGTSVAPNGAVSPTLNFLSGRTLSDGAAHILCVRYDYTNGWFHAWLDGLLVGTGPNLFAVPSSNYGGSAPAKPTGNISIGSWRGVAGSTDCPTMNLGGVYIASKAHSDAERRGVHAMLAARFGITLLSTL